MYREHNIPIIVSGGLLANRQLTEAEANRYFLLKLGIPAEKIVMSPSGLNTQQETAALRELLYGKTVALVTSASHQLRAKRHLELQSVRVIPIPVDFLSENGDLWAGPDLKSLARSHRAFYEWLGLAQQYFSVHL
ncbi:hypothetical protein GCM10009092_37660 [Bowmanella denitrificans]|uniref:DUF218 domain-containing protein n=2 Tax=Bowmanella denitrificans TaxID=366582 RepID=A0ABN0XPY0_9ALTE